MKSQSKIIRPQTQNYEGTISIPFYISEAVSREEVENLINDALDKFGKFDLGRMSWDNPDWTFEQVAAE